MAYQKTEKVLLGIGKRKDAMLAACIHIISKHGMEGLTTANIAARAKVAEGTIYKYFPDKTELVAAVVARVFAEDMEAIKTISFGVEADQLANAAVILYRRVAESPRLMTEIGTSPLYREGIKKELQQLIRKAGIESAPLFAAMAYGAVFEAAGSRGPRDAAALTTALLKGMGLRARVSL